VKKTQVMVGLSDLDEPIMPLPLHHDDWLFSMLFVSLVIN
jgi:hypothetical protein